MALETRIEKQLADFRLDVSFTVENAPLSVLGASGAGKTMLLRCIAGIENPDRGRITLNERALFDSEKKIATPARDRHLGMLFQNYALFPHRTVAENLRFGIENSDVALREKTVASLIVRMHLAGLESRYPRELSGGEQQRVALGRALAIDPEALLLDEPLAALDTHLRSQVERQLQETFAAYPRPVLLVTHNIEEAYRLGETLMVLARGRIAALGPKEEIFRRPPSAEVARLTGCKNISRARRNHDGTIEAIDWGCTLRVHQEFRGEPKFIGIRAHQIEFLEAGARTEPQENVFGSRLAQFSETPFRVTMFLSLGVNAEAVGDRLLQAEVFKEKWNTFRSAPLPWHVRLAPDALFLMKE
jgi:molybdate transport system permease protein